MVFKLPVSVRREDLVKEIVEDVALRQAQDDILSVFICVYLWLMVFSVASAPSVVKVARGLNHPNPSSQRGALFIY
ncbi:MAG: hypothetical protein GWN16_08540 [Calditrichae bacterium]|nr:hypothetical protein [Calditrichia bacterium]NIV72237.1 hypothetical protein [Calditrichia bacterium]NIW79484.1 hypothetical protein [Calditrichia bacterium]